MSDMGGAKRRRVRLGKIEQDHRLKLRSLRIPPSENQDLVLLLVGRQYSRTIGEIVEWNKSAAGRQ